MCDEIFAWGVPGQVVGSFLAKHSHVLPVLLLLCVLCVFGPNIHFLETSSNFFLQSHARTPKRYFVLTTFWDEITFGHIT